MEALSDLMVETYALWRVTLPHPNFVYLGTTDGHIFGSEDGGRHWQLLGLAGLARNATVTAILVDPHDSEILFASTWTREKEGEGGGIYRSTDRGRTWQASGLFGHAVRALVAAPSDPDILVAGALDGVFRSRDGGKNWEMITPANDPELRNFDSLAIDPQDPEIIYAGTFHLPWKTVDGGRDWAAIHEGMIDDSDVLSLAVNPSNPQQVFASACSGIYRSDDAGAHWKRVQGIPDSSKRTLVIRFDPGRTNTLYAGTTDGLWKSTDAGARWHRVSPDSWVVNALAVLPTNDELNSVEAMSAEPISAHTLIGTEQQGVLVSDSCDGQFRARERRVRTSPHCFTGCGSRKSGPPWSRHCERLRRSGRIGRLWRDVGAARFQFASCIRATAIFSADWLVRRSCVGRADAVRCKKRPMDPRRTGYRSQEEHDEQDERDTFRGCARTASRDERVQCFSQRFGV